MRFVGRRRRDDAGSALVLALGLSIILVGLVLASVTLAVRNTRSVRSDTDAKAALAAAQAGIDEYQSRLITDDSYWSLGNTDATNLAFTAAGRSVPGATGSSASFSYRVLNTPDEIARDGFVRLQVTGRSGAGGAAPTVSRTLTAVLRPSGFLNYLAFIDKTTVDPDLLSNFTYVDYNGNSRHNGQNHLRYVDLGAGIRDACSKYWYAGRSSPSFTASATTPVTIWNTWSNSAVGTITDGGTADDFSCRDVYYLNSTLRGPFHSNDTIAVSGSPLWTDPQFESSWENPPDPARRWRGTGTPSTGTAGEPGYWPVYAPVIQLPAGNQGLIDYTEPAVVGSTSTYRPGCRYTGITRIEFTGTSMKVLSPSTTSAPSRCLDTANRSNEQTVAIPPVIYVDAAATSCTYGAVGYPRSGEFTGSGTNTTDYTCTRGTAIVKGNVDGRVTVAARDDILIADDLTIDDNGAGTDMIGLVADNKVWVYHPVDDDGDNLLSDGNAPNVVQAAILSVRHSYLLQNWDLGDVIETTMTFYGSYAQAFMGPFGTFNAGNNQSISGYRTRDQRYDPRMRSIQPPFFLPPASSAWKAVSVTDG